MKTILLCIVLLGPAYGNGIRQVINSAPVGTMLVHADISPVVNTPADSISARLFFSTDNQQTWTERPMSRMAEPGYDSTWQAVIELPPGPGPVWYYVNADDGTGYATQSPVNSANIWPVTDNLLARVARNPADPPRNPRRPWLDIAGARVGRSNDRFYVELTNNHDSWPTSAGFLSWHAYSFGFANPEASSDSWVIAPVYVDALWVMQTGLFAINRYTGDIPERIGDITAVTSGNRLLMQCNIADITGDSRFGPWPNSQGWLTVAATTQTVGATGATTNDTTVAGLFHALRTQYPTIGSNRPFSLGAGSVMPDSGTSTTEFSFSVSYTDPDSNPPTVRQVEADNRRLMLVPDNRRYWRGTTFRAGASGFAPGNHTASFILSDGAVAETTRVSFYVRGGSAVGEETGYAELPPLPRLPTVARGNLYLPASNFCRYSLLGSTGRKVAELRVGYNDISRFSPGVYFIRADYDRCLLNTAPAGNRFHRLLLLR